ncbi:uncharacterized protein LOC119735746 [Patiria miniata]|uniref:Amine oxidase domain-containing protein n=1 Tax=Patiria miniata TaxID=46514 RepID=A0A914ANJ2_PATMI|nr:uncharacterized protein LOC119735746 [Patiria miniata]
MASRFNRVFVSLTSVMAVLLLVSIVIRNMDGRMLPGRGAIFPTPVIRSRVDMKNSKNIRTLSDTSTGPPDAAEGRRGSNGNQTTRLPSEIDDQETSRESKKQHRIVIIGSGPTALGAAKRLHDFGQGINNSVITILEELGKLGGRASSVRDDKGFLWDDGFHVVFSHYTYFDRVLNMAVPEWNYRRRSSFAFMKGSDDERRFIPYPVQNNIHVMDKIDQQKSLQGLEEIAKNPITSKPNNFDEWLLQKFGVGLADVYMRKYNPKMWTVDPKKMNSAWVGEKVAVPNIEEIKTKIKEVDINGTNTKDSEWEPNRFFRFPKYNGTGGILQSVAKQLPSHWFKFHEKVTGIDIDQKIISIERGDATESKYTLEYDTLISTIPLDILTGFLKSRDQSLEQMLELASQLVYTHTHVVGVGLTGQLPKTLADKSWLYFPDSDSPFYRVAMFSNYSDDHVPKAGAYWSLMCEIAEPQTSSNPAYWSRENLIKESIQSLVMYGFITADMVVSKHYRRLEHGYPVPSLKRDMILDTVQPWLKNKDIYSRGLFGGWKYEVGKQDHSFMQGVEAVDNFLHGIPELTYTDPNLANSKKNTGRKIPLDYEIVVAQYQEDLDWVKPFANRTFVYHKGGDAWPTSQWYSWERLPNIGRESHSYLHHIITNYDHLPDVTVFYPGEIADHKRHCRRNPLDAVSKAKRGIPCSKGGGYSVHKKHVISAGDKYLLKPKNKYFRPSDFTFMEFYEYIYGHKPRGGSIPHCWKACFAATREMIRKHPLEFYQRAISAHGNSSNAEESHYFERLWFHMFHDEP